MHPQSERPTIISICADKSLIGFCCKLLLQING